LVALAGAAQAIELTRSLAVDARSAAQQGRPLLLFVTQPGCPFCERARREVLRHLAVDPAYTSRAVFRELSIGTTVTGFDGKPQSGLEAARALGVRLYPTVLIVDAAGTPLAAPLRGYSPDFYTATLDGRLSDAEQALKARK
jgi:thioredoxin-related protein